MRPRNDPWAHVVVAIAVVGLMGVSAKPLDPPVVAPPDILTVTLVTEVMPPPARRPPPAAPQRVTPPEKSVPVPPRKTDMVPTDPSNKTSSNAASAEADVFLFFSARCRRLATTFRWVCVVCWKRTHVRRCWRRCAATVGGSGRRSLNRLSADRALDRGVATDVSGLRATALRQLLEAHGLFFGL